MRGPTLRQLRDWLGAPGWQGWSAIFSGLTLLTAISVSVILFRFTQLEEEKRLEATRPNFRPEIRVQESADEPFLTTREWLLTIDLTNDGPGASTFLRVDFLVGGTDVEPVSEPLVSHGSLWLKGSIAAPERGYLLEKYELRLSNPVLPGDTIRIWFWFSVDPALDSHLLNASAGQLFWTEGRPQETLVGTLLSSLTIQGPNLYWHHDWHYHDAAR